MIPATVIRRAACVWLLLLLLCVAGAYAAAPGALDPTFGVDGKIRTDIARDDFGWVVRPLPDGRFVVGGGTENDEGSADFTLAYYLPDGGLDPSYGTGGVVRTPILPNDDRITAIEVLSDGRLLAAGTTDSGFIIPRTGLARYLPDGNLDPSFGVAGTLVGSSGVPTSLVIRPDGRLNVVIAGNDFIVHGYLPDGGVDTAFGVAGVATIDLSPGLKDQAVASLLQPDGKLLLAGTATTPTNRFALCRLLPNGKIDPSFGSSGYGVYGFPFNASAEATALALQPDGSILVVGTVDFDSRHFAVMRVRSNGDLDSSFGSGGFAITDFYTGHDRAFSVKVQPDGRILVLGSCAMQSVGDVNFAVARYLPNGSLDPQFGNFGKAQVDLGLQRDETVTDAFIDSESRLTVVGQAGNLMGMTDLGLARFLLGNYWPVAKDDLVTTPEDTPVELSGALDPLLNDTDANGDPIQRAMVSPPSHGEVTDVGGVLRYEPDPDYTGQDSFTYQVTDGEDLSVPGVVRITVTPVNDAPAAQNDAYSTNEDVPLTVNAPGVLANDLDLEGTALTAALISPPAFGVATVSTTGRLTYTPSLNFAGTDTLQYQVSDGSAVSNLATVTITVLPVNDAPVATAQFAPVSEDVATGITLAASDPDGNPLTYNVLTLPAYGSLSGSPPGLTYTPAADYNGPDSFTYRASDGVLQSATATVSITVSPVNDPPLAVNNSYTADEDGTRVVAAASGVLANDSDPEGSALSAVLATGPVHGALTLGADGSFTYVPTAGYQGSDTFTYRASDGATMSAIATVSLTVLPANDAPTAGDLTVGLAEDGSAIIMLAGSDPDGDSLTYSLLTAPARGSLAGIGASQLYTPQLNYNGTDSFRYQVSDGQTTSSVATVSITVSAVNDPPTAADLTKSLTEDSTAAITLAGTDPDGDTLTYSILVAPARGALTGSGASRLYTPQFNYSGTDLLRYQVSDGQATSAAATVSLAIVPANDAPSAGDLSVSVIEDTPTVLTLTGSDPEGDALTYTVLAAPAHGSLAGSGASRLYTPAANYSGPDTFRYQVSDGQLTSGIATVSMNVSSVSDPPNALDVTVTTDEDVAAPVLLLGSDPEGDPFQYTQLSEPAHGVLSGTGPNLTYQPAQNYYGPDSFTYKTTAGSTDSRIATVTITVGPVNDAPAAGADSYTGQEDTLLSIAVPGVLENDSDTEGGTLTALLATEPAHGTLNLAAGGSFSYSPDPNYSGGDNFTYRATDGAAQSDAVTVTITINPVNDPPSATGQSVTTAEDAAKGITLAGVDPDGDAMTYEVVSGPAHGALSGTAPNLLYTPAPNYHGSDSFLFRVRDGAVNSGNAAVAITVTPVGDVPVANGQSVQTAEDQSLGVTLTASDADGDALSYEIVAAPAHGMLTGTAPNVTYVPVPNYAGLDQFRFRVSDGATQSAEAIVEIQVTAVADPPSAGNDAYSTSLSTTLNVAAPGVLANDSDVDGGALTPSVLVEPTHGAVVLGANGSFAYTPQIGYSGADQFTYRVSDGALQSTAATVSIQVGSAPPSSTAGASVKGSGTIGAGASRATFKINASVSNTGLSKGTFTFTSPTVKIKKATLTSIRIVPVAQGKEARVYARVTVSRTETWDLLLHCEDLASAPGADRFGLTLSTGFATGVQNLVTGKIAILSPP